MAHFSTSLRQTPDGGGKRQIIAARTRFGPSHLPRHFHHHQMSATTRSASAFARSGRTSDWTALLAPWHRFSSTIREYSAEQGAMRPISCAVALSLPLGPIGRATLVILTAGSFLPRLVIAFVAIRTST